MKPEKAKISAITAILLAVWTISMVFVYSEYQRRRGLEGKDIVSSDVKMDSEERRMYNVYRNGSKVGYRIERTIHGGEFYLATEECVLKMNLAGLSREVYLQSIVAIDTTTYNTRQLQFTIRSGSHMSEFTGSVRSDTLYIEVQNYNLAPKRTGYFIVDKSITFPVGIPFFLSRAGADLVSLMVFDPIVFNEYVLHTERKNRKITIIGDKRRTLLEYELSYGDSDARLWLDPAGGLVRADGYMYFGGGIGNFTIEQTESRDVFLMPVDVAFGNDTLKALAIHPDRTIENPRAVEYARFRLEGIRAAYVDVTSSNQKKLSNTPVEIGIYDHPVLEGDRRDFGIQAALSDTSLTGSSDYIQPADARIIRTAREIVAAYSDTLAMAEAISRWVNENMQKNERITLIRSVDILRERKGGFEEYTKLFTALARSVGIHTQINLGLVCREDGVFRYHSWPSVFTGDVWHDVDPYYGQARADATHITLVRGDFERLVELLRLVNNLSIQVIEYR